MNVLKNPAYRKPGIFLLAGYSLVFFSFGFTGILHHEMWLDEMHHWLLAKESNSLRELFLNMRFEGHPPLWNIILFFLTGFTVNPFHMQLCHILLSTAAMIVFFYYAPFSVFIKTCVLCSYFIFYEFNVISRNYAIGILLIWIIFALLSDSKKHYLVLCLLTGLLANVHLFFLFISIGVFMILLFDTFRKRYRTEWVTGILLYSVFLCIAVKFIIPPENHFLNHYASGPVFSFHRLERACSVFIKAFLHVPDFTITNCWNSNFLLREFRSYFILPARQLMVSENSSDISE